MAGSKRGEGGEETGVGRCLARARFKVLLTRMIHAAVRCLPCSATSEMVRARGRDAGEGCAAVLGREPVMEGGVQSSGRRGTPRHLSRLLAKAYLPEERGERGRGAGGWGGVA